MSAPARSRGRERAAAPRGERRSHAERTAQTRARIVAATVDCIHELGFARTTAQEITRRAGVTWGAVQHQFGDKDGILLAVLEDSFARFEARVASVPRDGVPLDARVSLFVARAWQHFASREHASTFEILLDHLRRPDLHPAREPSWQARMFAAWDRVWRALFPDAAIPRRRRQMLQHYTISVLSGLASTRLLAGPEASIPPVELALLEETLRRELRGAGSSAPRDQPATRCSTRIRTPRPISTIPPSASSLLPRAAPKRRPA